MYGSDLYFGRSPFATQGYDGRYAYRVRSVRGPPPRTNLIWMGVTLQPHVHAHIIYTNKRSDEHIMYQWSLQSIAPIVHEHLICHHYASSSPG